MNLDIFAHTLLGKILPQVLAITLQTEGNYSSPPGSVFSKMYFHPAEWKAIENFGKVITPVKIGKINSDTIMRVLTKCFHRSFYSWAFSKKL